MQYLLLFSLLLSVTQTLYTQEEGIPVKTYKGAKLMTQPGFSGEVIEEIPQDTEVFIVGLEGGYWRVKHKDRIGYVAWFYINSPFNNKEIVEKAREIQSRFTSDLKQQRSVIESHPLWVKSHIANVRKGSSTDTKVVAQIRRGEKIFLQEQVGDWCNVKIINHDKYDYYLNGDENLEEFYSNGWIHNSLISETYIKKPTESEIRRQDYIRAHPSTPIKFKDAILSGKIILGMSDEMIRASWGDPDDINRTVGSWGVHEQWVYGKNISSRTYLYIENDVLTSWQD